MSSCLPGDCKGCHYNKLNYTREGREYCNSCKRAYAGADMEYHSDRYVPEEVVQEQEVVEEEVAENTSEGNDVKETDEKARNTYKGLICLWIGLIVVLTMIEYFSKKSIDNGLLYGIMMLPVIPAIYRL